jgi:hypothetical protein
MHKTTARFLLTLMTIALAGMAWLGFFGALCLTFAFPHDFGRTKDVLETMVVWAFPLIFLASMFASWRIFRYERYIFACLVAFFPLALVSVYFLWVVLW